MLFNNKALPESDRALRTIKLNLLLEAVSNPKSDLAYSTIF